MKSALVTGASSGLGRALAIELGERGCRTVLIARRQQALLEVAERIGPSATAFPFDLSDADASHDAIAQLDREHHFDLVIANAGVGPRRGADAKPWAWSTIAAPFHVNFCGAAATLTAPLDGMIARGDGHIVAISSLSSFAALPGSAAYCAPKAGLSMLVDCLRLDLAHHGVAATNVYLGFVDTPMVAHRRAGMPQLMAADVAARRIVKALATRPASIDMPQPLALGARVAAALPRLLRDRILRGVK